MVEAIDEAMAANMQKYGEHELVDVTKEGLNLGDDAEVRAGASAWAGSWGGGGGQRGVTPVQKHHPHSHGVLGGTGGSKQNETYVI